MHVVRVQVGPLETNCWIVGATAEGPVVVIDPADDYPVIEAAVGAAHVELVVLTHSHFDHLGAAAQLVETTGAPLAIHADDAPFISDAEGTGGMLFGFPRHVAPAASRLLADGDEIHVGALVLTVLHTPGHTTGGICLLAADTEGGPSELFSGDTLFAGSVGRTDFPRGEAGALSRSIATQLVGLAPDTIVHPGHGPDTTIGREARINPFWPRI